MPFTIKKLLPGDVTLAKQLFWFFQIDDDIAEPVIPSDEYIMALLLKDENILTIRSYLYSIFYNLILNSIKYRQTGLSPVIVIKNPLT